MRKAPLASAVLSNSLQLLLRMNKALQAVQSRIRPFVREALQGAYFGGQHFENHRDTEQVCDTDIKMPQGFR